jgi:hypothetical protein
MVAKLTGRIIDAPAEIRSDEKQLRVPFKESEKLPHGRRWYLNSFSKNL